MIDTVLLNSLWQGALIVAIAALTTLFVPKHHAATRYAVWFTALLALAILPVASVLHPAPAIGALPAPVEHTAAAPSLVTAKAALASGSWLAFLWSAGVALALIRLGLSFSRISGIVRSASPAPELGADVMISARVDFPIAARIVSPLIIIPKHLAETLDRADLGDIVRHERAHIERRDILANLIQRVIEALLFFNPWTYLIGRRLIAEREAACDDRAVHASGQADRYASCLARLAQSPRASHAPLLTPSAIGSRRMLVGRIARLLSGKATELNINYRAVGASVLAFALLTALLQTSTGLAANGSAPLGSGVAVAASACVFPTNLTAHTPEEKAKLRKELFATSAEVKILNPAAPNIPRSGFRPNATANALVTVAPDGHPASAKIVLSSGSAGMDRAVVNAAMASTYSPAMHDCKLVAGQYLFQVSTGPT
jgi:beta-lactamase regulating signal transducer with metallopeptidase domain